MNSEYTNQAIKSKSSPCMSVYFLFCLRNLSFHNTSILFYSYKTDLQDRCGRSLS